MKKIVLYGCLFLCLILVIGFLYCIMCSPYLENNRRTIDVVTNLTSPILSGVAILIAIFVPLKIAKRQNAINLFEKRFRCYCLFQKYYEFSRILNVINRLEIITLFSMWFLDGKNPVNSREIKLCLKKDESVMTSGRFLFPASRSIPKEKLKSKLVDILKSVSKIADFVDFDSKDLSAEERRVITQFIDECDIIKKYTEEMEEELIRYYD